MQGCSSITPYSVVTVVKERSTEQNYGCHVNQKSILNIIFFKTVWPAALIICTYHFLVDFCKDYSICAPKVKSSASLIERLKTIGRLVCLFRLIVLNFFFFRKGRGYSKSHDLFTQTYLDFYMLSEKSTFSKRKKTVSNELQMYVMKFVANLVL